MNVLQVLTQKEPQTLNVAMRRTAVAELKELIHPVDVSDLYAMKFNSVGRRRFVGETSE